MASIMGQRTKTYLGLGSDEVRVTAPSVRRQAAVTVLWLLAGIVIWILWSASIGSWLVFFGLIMLVGLPIIRNLRRRADRRQDTSP
jgi:Flp pilus assembly protein TadB